MKKILIIGLLSINCCFANGTITRGSLCKTVSVDDRAKNLSWVSDNPECKSTKDTVSAYTNAYIDKLMTMCLSSSKDLDNNSNNPAAMHQILQNNADATGIMFKEWVSRNIESCKSNPGCFNKEYCEHMINYSSKLDYNVTIPRIYGE